MFFIPGGRKRLEELASGQETESGDQLLFFCSRNNSKADVQRRIGSNAPKVLFLWLLGREKRKVQGRTTNFYGESVSVCLAGWLIRWFAGAGVEQAPLDVLERSLATSPLAALPSIRRHPFYFLFCNYFHFPGLWRNLLSI
jgi:hypothetical protein